MKHVLFFAGRLAVNPVSESFLLANNVSVGYAGYRAILFCDDEPCRISATGEEYFVLPKVNPIFQQLREF
jgi:hypothetical protein